MSGEKRDQIVELIIYSHTPSKNCYVAPLAVQKIWSLELTTLSWKDWYVSFKLSEVAPKSMELGTWMARLCDNSYEGDKEYFLLNSENYYFFWDESNWQIISVRIRFFSFQNNWKLADILNLEYFSQEIYPKHLILFFCYNLNFLFYFE